MKTAIIIPARFGSTRFPGKPLHILASRPLIEWTWRAARETGWPVWIATDDHEIAAVAQNFGADTVMTGARANGTERCAQAAEYLGLQGTVINWQGDSPLIPAQWAIRLADAVEIDRIATVATPVQRADLETMRRLWAEHQISMIGATTAVIGSRDQAVYFSKSILPTGTKAAWLHVGMYAYRAGALEHYGRDPSMMELAEGLEQLRWLDRGHSIRCVEMEQRPMWEVNNPSDVAIVEAMLESRLAAA